jgi:hypothetical protein
MLAMGNESLPDMASEESMAMLVAAIVEVLACHANAS